MNLINFSRGFAAFVIVLSPFMTQGCTQEDTICQLVCDCEQCDDVREHNTCIGIDTQANIADIYGCSEAWAAYAACVVEHGRCDPTTEEWPSFTTDDQCDNASATLEACIDAASAHAGVAPLP